MRRVSLARSPIGNMVKNYNFENAPPTNVLTTSGGVWINGATGGGADPSGQQYGWATQTLSGGSANGAMFDNTQSYNGSYSMGLVLGNPNNQIQVQNLPSTSSEALIRNGIPVTPGVTYNLSFWMKTQLTAGSGGTGDGAFLQLLGRSYAGSLVQGSTSSAVTSTTGWTQYSVAMTTSPGVFFATIKLNIVSLAGLKTLTMKAWFDQVLMFPATIPTRPAAPGRTLVTRSPL